MPAPPLFDATFLRKLEMLALVSRKIFAGKTRGERRSSRRGGSVEFADYRQYAPGDDFRAIDWNAYARLEHLFLKLFVEEEDLAVHVLLDASKSMDFGEPATKLALGKKLAAAIAYCALAGYDRASVTVFGGAAGLDGTPLLRGKGRIFRIFQVLAEADARGGAGSFNAAVRAFVERKPKPGLVVVVSDLLDPQGTEEGLKRLRYGPFEPRVLHVLAPEELDPRLGGDHRLLDSEGAAGPIDVSLDARTLRVYRQRLAAFLEGTEAFCRAHGIGYARTSSAVAVEDVVLKALRAARMVA